LSTIFSTPETEQLLGNNSSGIALGGPQFSPPAPLNPDSVLAAGLTADEIRVESRAKSRGADWNWTQVSIPQVHSADPELCDQYQEAAEKLIAEADQLMADKRAEVLGEQEAQVVNNLNQTRALIHEKIEEAKRELAEAELAETMMYESGRLPVNKGRNSTTIRNELTFLNSQAQSASEMLATKSEQLHGKLKAGMEGIRQQVLAKVRLEKRRCSEKLAEDLLSNAASLFAAQELERRLANNWHHDHSFIGSIS
jgi:hypothetical protein